MLGWPGLATSRCPLGAAWRGSLGGSWERAFQRGHGRYQGQGAKETQLHMARLQEGAQRRWIRRPGGGGTRDTQDGPLRPVKCSEQRSDIHGL